MNRPGNEEEARRMAVDLLVKILGAKPDLIMPSGNAAERTMEFTKAADVIGAYIFPEHFKK